MKLKYRTAYVVKNIIKKLLLSSILLSQRNTNKNTDECVADITRSEYALFWMMCVRVSIFVHIHICVKNQIKYFIPISSKMVTFSI